LLTGSSHGIIIGVAPRPKSGRASSTLGITRARWAPHSAYIQLDGGLVPNRVAFAETLRLCEGKGYLTGHDSAELKKLANLRNPLAHYRSLDDPSHVDRRSMTEKAHFLEILERDAFFAIALIMHILGKKPFRVG